MVNFIKKHKFLVYIFVIAFTISAFVTIFSIYESLLWSLSVKQPEEKTIVDYFKQIGCELSKEEDNDDDTYEFDYYTKDSSCNYDIYFYKTYYSDVLEENLNEFKEDTKYNTRIDDFWEFSSSSYEYYAELGQYYRVFTQTNGAVLAIESKNKNKNEVDQIFKDFNLDYKYKDIMELEGDMIILFVVLFFFFWWQIDVKFGRKGWVALIPIYNLICLSDDIFHDKGRAILCFIPIANIVYCLLVFWNLGKNFKKGKSYCWLTMLFPYIFIPLLIFSDYEFQIKS